MRKLNISEKLGGGRLTTDKPIEIKIGDEIITDTIEDKAQHPTVLRIINTLTFKNKVPIEYTYRSIANSKTYYSDKPVYVLYGIRKTFWTQEFPAQ